MGKYSKIWPMYQGTKSTAKREIYKCTECGGETHPEKGHNGAPDLHNCHPGCPCRNSSWKPGNKQRSYDENFRRTFPSAPDPGF